MSEVPSHLSTLPSQSSGRAVAKELDAPDPAPEVGRAILGINDPADPAAKNRKEGPPGHAS